MDINAMIDEILNYLFEGYIDSGGTSLFSIKEITQKYGADSSEVGRYLVSEGLVKNQQFTHTGFVCSINMAGIYKINPQFIDGHTSSILSVLGTSGNDWTSIMDILNFEPKDFQIAHGLAKLLENNGLIDTQFRHNDVIIKLTFRGIQLYEESKASFF